MEEGARGIGKQEVMRCPCQSGLLRMRFAGNGSLWDPVQVVIELEHLPAPETRNVGILTALHIVTLVDKRTRLTGTYWRCEPFIVEGAVSK